ncbi:MAG TPA: hypothetical protein VFZ79_08400 [Acidimicrobiales bacterium]
MHERLSIPLVGTCRGPRHDRVVPAAPGHRHGAASTVPLPRAAFPT